jgi:hypothetical protein
VIGLSLLIVLLFKDTCTKDCVEFTPNYLDWKSPGIGRFLTFMALQSAVMFFLLLAIDYRLFARLRAALRRLFSKENRSYSPVTVVSGFNTITPILPATTADQTATINDDNDVSEEAQRIQMTPHHDLSHSDVMVINQVSKIYNGRFRAVDQISFGVKRRECFGLLGVNGA